MNVFVYIVEGQLYKKMRNCWIFITQLYCTTSDIVANPKLYAKSMKKSICKYSLFVL